MGVDMAFLVKNKRFTTLSAIAKTAELMEEQEKYSRLRRIG